MKPLTSTTTPPRPDTTRHGAHGPKLTPWAKSSFAGHLATHRGLPGQEAARVTAALDTKRVLPSQVGRSDDTGTGSSQKRQRAEPDDAATPSDGAPFRPLPACVFAPSVGRALPMTPAPAPPDVARLASELLRSMHVGGERGRGRVRLVLESARHGEPLQITLEETSTGITATLPTADDEDSRRLVRAIAQELQRRGIEVG